MNRKIRYWASGIFLLATLISLGLYFSVSEKTYSDQTIKTLSDKLQTYVIGFLNENQKAFDTLKTDFQVLNPAKLTPDFLNRYAQKTLQNHPEMQGLIFYGPHFHFLFARDKKYWASTYDTLFEDTLTNWVRLDNNLRVVSRWTDAYNYFIDDVSIRRTRKMLEHAGGKPLWRVLLHEGSSNKDLILSSGILKLSNGHPLAFAFVYNLRKHENALFRLENTLHPIISLVTPFNRFTVPLFNDDSTFIKEKKPLFDQINRLLNNWKKTSPPQEKSYLFIQNGKRYWMHVALLPDSYGIKALAYATAENELKAVARFKTKFFGYAALFFGILAFLGFISLRKKNPDTKKNPGGKILDEHEIVDIIKGGENEQTEFKSSLRWDYREQKVNPALETVILKSISAFANGKGGILLIGVQDDGEILGLQPDFDTLKKKDVDGFELHLRRLIKNQFGISFTTAHLQIYFPVIDGKTICVIQVTPSHHPLYLKTKNKNGTPVEKFYVRMGNASQEISSLREIQNYIKNRFEL
jgi:hypothetical protein